MAARARNYIAAEELAQFVGKINSSIVDDNSLKEIAALLDSTDGAVRMWAVGALRHFGITAADNAHVALIRMGIVPGHFGCSHRQEQARN